MLNKIYHRFVHWFGLNNGNVVTWIESGQICIGFKCSGCGKIAESSVDRINESEIIK